MRSAEEEEAKENPMTDKGKDEGEKENSWFRHLTFALVGISLGESDRFLSGSRRTDFGPLQVDDPDRQSSREPERKRSESR